MSFRVPAGLLVFALVPLAGCGSGDDTLEAPVSGGEGPLGDPTAPPGDSAAPPGDSAAPPADSAAPPGAPPPEPSQPAPGEGMAPAGPSPLGSGVMSGSGMSADRYAKGNVTRDGDNYFFMANGWGPAFESQTVSWNGTSFIVETMSGAVGPNYEPATYPTVFCGRYSSEVSQECGLPAPLSAIESLRTGWRWAPNGNVGQYNAAYDIWMAKDDGSFGGFVMVWLREPEGQQPAGGLSESDVTVANVPGTWDIWSGVVYETVPIVNWVRNQGEDSTELEFDVMDFVRDAELRGYELPGTQINAVAVGFEIWQGPIANLESQDFYIDVVLK